ncbi:MAG: hypothetical protein A3G34_06500 [Candidatus Lindowbacteria bacterium RIFCSPLOWO2_12_FULL_62_27]|nr:MAG: hypothetical protein A3G34_06500 [Candidatus Lindowbacteria bacterium RIFCSPLOWO2_12_FULL_62_27]
MARLLVLILTFFVGFIPRIRKIAHTNLRIAFGPAGRRIYARSLLRLADNVCALLSACRKNPARQPPIRFDAQALANVPAPPPWICVTGHLGPIDLLSKFSRVFNSPMAVVVRPPDNWIFRKILSWARRRIGVETIEKRDVIRAAYRAVKEGKTVAIIADHNAGYQGVFLPFLGFPASTTRLPAVLALRFNKPMVMGFIRRDGAEFLAWIEKVIVPDPDADPKEEERRLLSEMNAVFTDVIRRYPDEWFWFHRRWKTRPGDREASILR